MGLPQALEGASTPLVLEATMLSAEDQIRRELEPGERLLWCGRPRPYALLSKDLVLAIGFLAVVFVIAAIAGTGSLVQKGPQASQIPFAGFLLASGGMAAYLFRVLPQRGSEAAYGVTDRRAIIVDDVEHKRVERVPLHPTSQVMLYEGRRGADALRRPVPGDTIGSISFPDLKRGRGEDEYTPEFTRVEDARQVMALIARVMDRAPTSWSSQD
jgi:hypothetical protein